MRKAVFLDRDGVLVKEKHHLTKLSEVELIRGSASAIKTLNKRFLVIVISNQSVIARGLSTRENVDAINSLIGKRLASKGARIDAFYYCPHHPSFTGECDCRKPGIGLLKKAVKKFGIDLGKSFFVGDKTLDILTGKNAGCKTILVKTGYGGKDNGFYVKPDYEASNILAAAKLIAPGKPRGRGSVPNRLKAR